VCGSASGVCAKIVVYPLDVIKKRLEVQGFAYGNVVVGTARQYRGFLHCLRQVVTYEGYRSLYKGLSPSILKAFVASGLHFAAYEHCIWVFRRTIPVG
jgi:solute carrier family 25 (mitochondrial thiamine pyrophosphate transporter), member 19